jgi:hypothetical protein
MRLSRILSGIIAFLFGLGAMIALINFLYKLWFRFRFWLRYRSCGKFILFVYSDSPIWKEYIEANILPRIGRHAVTLNWSERKRWTAENPFEQKVFQSWAGYKEYNPVAIILRPKGKVKVIRFLQAFRDYKHGKEDRLKKAEQDLFKEVSDNAANAV